MEGSGTDASDMADGVIRVPPTLVEAVAPGYGLLPKKWTANPEWI
jgi:hypothetical protein